MQNHIQTEDKLKSKHKEKAEDKRWVLRQDWKTWRDSESLMSWGRELQSVLQPFIHTFKHQQRSQPCKATCNSSDAMRVRCFVQGHLNRQLAGWSRGFLWAAWPLPRVEHRCGGATRTEVDGVQSCRTICSSLLRRTINTS